MARFFLACPCSVPWFTGQQGQEVVGWTVHGVGVPILPDSCSILEASGIDLEKTRQASFLVPVLECSWTQNCISWKCWSDSESLPSQPSCPYYKLEAWLPVGTESFTYQWDGSSGHCELLALRTIPRQNPCTGYGGLLGWPARQPSEASQSLLTWQGSKAQPSITDATLLPGTMAGAPGHSPWRTPIPGWLMVFKWQVADIVSGWLILKEEFMGRILGLLQTPRKIWGAPGHAGPPWSIAMTLIQVHESS